MKRNISLICLFALILVLFGCSKSIYGTYVNRDNPNEYMILKSDGTFFFRSTGVNSVGKYEIEIENDVIIFEHEEGHPIRSKIQGNKILTPGGRIWIKK